MCGKCGTGEYLGTCNENCRAIPLYEVNQSFQSLPAGHTPCKGQWISSCVTVPAARVALHLANLKGTWLPLIWLLCGKSSNIHIYNHEQVPKEEEYRYCQVSEVVDQDLRTWNTGWQLFDSSEKGAKLLSIRGINPYSNQIWLVAIERLKAVDCARSSKHYVEYQEEAGASIRKRGSVAGAVPVGLPAVRPVPPAQIPGRAGQPFSPAARLQNRLNTYESSAGSLPATLVCDVKQWAVPAACPASPERHVPV
ncbi:hypothetical protein Anapl_17938 [Anas platyrhynchos]|uniref:Uncharacterized protein n=1 Tax=Anas platyrhynchos TaxID=8839 RepID=R0KFA3_ANAPL|nr:hypothetical protein Anapl_17938 [Anas platyrhynchos]